MRARTVGSISILKMPLNDDRKKSVCAAINAAGGSYQPTDIIGAVREDAGGLREPIDDLVEMDGVTSDDAKL